MISIPVSHNFINDKLNIILANNNLLSNETILNYGVLLFENQHTILNNYNIDSIVFILLEFVVSTIESNSIRNILTEIRLCFYIIRIS